MRIEKKAVAYFRHEISRSDGFRTHIHRLRDGQVPSVISTLD